MLAPTEIESACTGDHALLARTWAETPGGQFGLIAQLRATWSVWAQQASNLCRAGQRERTVCFRTERGGRKDDALQSGHAGRHTRSKPRLVGA